MNKHLPPNCPYHSRFFLLEIWGVLGPIFGSLIAYYSSYQNEKYRIYQEEKKITISQYPFIRQKAEHACKKFITSTSYLLNEVESRNLFYKKYRYDIINYNLKRNFTSSLGEFLTRYDYLRFFLKGYTGETIDKKITDNAKVIKLNIDSLISKNSNNINETRQLLLDDMTSQCSNFPELADNIINAKINPIQ